ncbi:glycosyltransferase [Pseudomonas sp. NFACC42-2]|uniref:glycosyltransferase n=1 Tax=Pseudomonas sp. NFACC42-2 TaxID=1566193 RepID=UPI0008E7B990|nr:glycosyltransferase [Pseudomonas sp. NFACC42-2]SFS28960.1 Glycosyltransferase involved in cell wall bisynthesis [Pseudomonas sp. NFACC42-2]
MSSPVVSVICCTYNQRSFIAEAIESFLAQKINVPFEIIVHDDASTDGTREILSFYAGRYPGLIRVIQQPKNIYSTGKRVFDVALSYAKGAYIAPCEGDDFWNDPLKLQKQLTFLEMNSDYGAVFTDSNVLVQETQFVFHAHDASRGVIPPVGDVKASLVLGNQYKSCTVLLRSEALKGYSVDADFLKAKMLDYIIWLHIAGSYKIGYIKDSTATYRVLQRSASHFVMHDGKVDFEKSAYKVSVFFNKRFGGVVEREELKSAYAHNMFIYSLRKREFRHAIGYFRCSWPFMAMAVGVVKRQTIALMRKWRQP